MKDRRKPTIAFLTTRWANVDDNIRNGEPPGGVPSVSRVWTTCLSHGFEVHVFILCQPDRGWPKETIELGGIKFHWIKQPFRGLTNWLHDRRLIGFCKPLWLIWQLQMAYRIIRTKVRPDIIYSMRTSFVILGWIWGQIARAKFVQRHYGTWLYHLWFEQKKWPQRIASLGTLLAFYIPTDMFIMTNDGTQGDKVAERVGFPMERFRFWINGVDKSLHMADFDSAAFKENIGVPADAPMLMTLGRLSYWKRIDRAIDATVEIRKEFPDARLVIVGGGALEGPLRRQVEELGLTDAVIFRGPVSHDSIKSYLNAADIFIMPNDLTNMCSTLIEGLTAGCCIITRDVGTTTEVAKDGENALVLSPGEAEDIAAAAVRILKDQKERKRLADGAYQYAMEHFQTWEERMEMEVEEMKRLLPEKVTFDN